MLSCLPICSNNLFNSIKFWGQLPPLQALRVIRGGDLLVEVDHPRSLGRGLDLLEGVTLAIDQDPLPPKLLIWTTTTRNLQWERRHLGDTGVHFIPS